MKNSIITILLLIFSFTTYAQYIEGKVLDAETQKPIKGAHVFMDNVEEGTQTYSNGKFHLKFPSATYENTYIYFSHIAYNTAVIPYDKHTNSYNIHLTQKTNQLKEIAISEKRNLSPYLSFTKLKSMGSRLHSFGSVLADGKIYVAGGNTSFSIDGSKKALMRLENSDLSQLTFDKFLQYSYSSYQTDYFVGNLMTYNISSNNWIKEKSVFKKRAHHNLNKYNNELMMLGGINLSINKKKEFLDNTIEFLNLNTKEKIVDETNPHQAANFASFVYQDDLIVLGGSIKKNRNGQKEYSNKVHLFNLKTGYWYELDSMTQAKETNGLLVNNKIYLVGGFNKKPLTTIESFDLTTQKWQHEGDLFFGINHPAIAHHNNIIYIFNNGKLLTFNTVSKELNEFHINLELQRARMHFANNKLYIVGGIRANDYSIEPSSNLYSIDIKDLNKTQIRRSKTP